MTAIRATMGPVEWGLLLLLSVLWGGSFFFTEIALTALPPFTVVWLRVALAAAVLWALVAARGLAVPRDGRTWTALAVMGLLNNALPFSLIVWGQTAISGSLAAILNAATPVWTVLLAHWLTRDERLAPHRLAGVVLGLGGVVVLVGPEALAGLAGGMSDGTGTAQLAVVAATVSYALAGIWGRRFAALPPLVTAGGQVTASAVLLLPAVVLVDRPWTLPLPGPAPMAAVVAFAVLSTALAYILYFRILARAGATNLLLVTLLIPASALLLGGLVLGERLAPADGAGLALIALGLLTIDGRLLGRAGRAL